MTRTPDLSAEILFLFVGKVEDRWPGKPPSAIAKVPTAATLKLVETGFVEDSQADLQVHGGAEKAVHHYSADHMAYWSEIYPDNAGFFKSGCFGENISTHGLDERNLCLGDILMLGSATVQICQGRQPCWKLNAHTGIETMAAQFQRTARTGWYYRVLDPGKVKAGDRVRLIERTCPEWSVERVTKARFDPRLSVEDARVLAASDVISHSWRKAFHNKTSIGHKENTDARLLG